MLHSFEKIVIVNLRERRDRRAQMRSELRKVGLHNDPRVSFFPAIRPKEPGPFSSIGARGVYESQAAILRDAAAGAHSVLILEDDCDFTAEASSYELPPSCDIFYGGYYAADGGNLQASDIVGAHMMGFSARGARLVSEYLAGLQISSSHPPIDGAYVWFRRAHPDVPTVFAVPPLGYQRPSRSDIEPGRFYNRVPGLKQGVELVRSARRAVRRQPVNAPGKLDW